MLEDELRAILLDDHRDLIGGGRCALQARQQIQSIVLGMGAKIPAKILLVATADLVVSQGRREQNRQNTRQHEETEDATSDAALERDRKTGKGHQ